MKNLNIVAQNKYFVTSLIVITIEIVFYFSNSVQLDIQFSSGTRIMIETNR